ncbi:hypothetical protein [Fundidesulfovibrio agrisoli]|uniref:hypothetical protein n=1 Tax=Fundidesulfovibrio agrisoli TaxID=2922717 RepID=UPI001FAC9AAD|nr:hypothetical protein [Fundidesulfovibrio agrisoli]
MRRAALPLSLLLALLAAAPASAQGNKELMDELVRQKQKAKDEVFQELKRQGQVPQNGTVTFEATVKRSPVNPEATSVRIDSVTVQERPSGNLQGKALDPVFAPRDPASGAVPSSGLKGGAAPLPSEKQPEVKVRESVTVVNGVPQNGASKAKKAKPRTKSTKKNQN